MKLSSMHRFAHNQVANPAPVKDVQLNAGILTNKVEEVATNSHKKQVIANATKTPMLPSTHSVFPTIIQTLPIQHCLSTNIQVLHLTSVKHNYPESQLVLPVDTSVVKPMLLALDAQEHLVVLSTYHQHISCPFQISIKKRSMQILDHLQG